MSEETRTNARLPGQDRSNYAMRRCEAIRQNFRDGRLTLPEAHAGISEYLRLHNVSTIGGVSPTVWLLIG